MGKLKTIILFILVIFISLGISSFCYADYYWTIQKSANKNMEVIHIGQQVDVTYTVMVGVTSDDGDDCGQCTIPAVSDQCVRIADEEGNELGRVCASRDMKPAFFILCFHD